MVASMRGPSTADVEHLSRACATISSEFPTLELCLSIGLLSAEQARSLKAAGAGMDQSQPEYQPPLLSRDLYDAHLGRSRAHYRECACRRSLDLLRWNHRDGRNR